MSVLRITWKKSAIGYDKKQRRIIQSLGLRKLQHTVDRGDTPIIRGMVEKVKHLVEIEGLDTVNKSSVNKG